ncbi:serine/threonine-protein kinase [Dechloromonas sp. H13]|uniref:serine/threonine-protein kinase n=1 Tax=Dechloromonas sp. H13 TaxID=2570193 RepID=UPI00129212B4|nr:serine/threonine-protein kinase [Dechloromonas sp. H13]
MKKKLGKYELIRKLGDGATSTVYLGRDPFAQRDVAIKVASPGILRDPEKGRLYSNLFLNEASLIGKLNHPHIVQIYDAVVTEDICYIVMEYVAGGTLDAHAQPGSLLPVDRVVELIFKCTRALDFAYRLGITHRDIKPANILLAGVSDIKISDFGAAITNARGDRTLVSGIGSPAYMSPQQVQEQFLDHRTDIYSLGVVMHQLLTGKLPFEASNNYNMVYQIVNGTPARPSAQRPGLPAVLDEIVGRAMARNLDDRYPTWQAFGHDLAQAVRNHLLKNQPSEFADTEKFATLRALPFFADFTDVEIWEALRFADWQHVAPGTAIMRDGEPGNFFCFVADGTLTVSKNGRKLDTLASGDCFGEMAVISRHGNVRSADVIAENAASIVTIRGEALEKASESCRMHFYQGFLDVLATRLALSNQRVAAI